jgi:hypothetical protein
MQRLTLILIGLVFWQTCSDREHANPFDPLNPETHGAPTGLSVYSNRDTISITWQPLEIDDLTEYVLYMACGNDPLQPLIRLPRGFSSYRVSDCQYDEWYRFAIKAVTRHDEGPLSDSVNIMPGPVNLLVADYYDHSVRRVRYDGQQVTATYLVNSPTGLAIDQGRGKIFVSSYWQRQLLILDQRLARENAFDLAGQPLDLVYDAERAELLVLEKEPARVVAYSSHGSFKYSCSLDLALGLDATLTLDSTYKILWVSSPLAAKVQAYNWADAQRPMLWQGDFQVTGRIAAPNGSAACWIPTDTGLVLQKLHGTSTLFRRDCRILGISLSPHSSECYFVGQAVDNKWLAGSVLPDQNQIQIHLDGDYARLYAIQVVPGTKGLGFFTVQTGYWRLLRFDSEGRQLGAVAEFSGRVVFELE